MPETTRATATWRYVALALGPLAALACYLLLPAAYTNTTGESVALSHAARATLAMMVWMALWWMTEAVAIEVTALLPLLMFPLLGITSVEKTALPYAADVVFLFLGGFVIAAAIQRWGLDRRLAWRVLTLCGARRDHVVGGVMAATAFTSMWVSNTATAAMMLPIAMAIIAASTAPGANPKNDSDYRLALLFAVAYGASIGGAATLIGSPPNGIAARFIAQSYGYDISFARWMMIGVPIMLVMLLAAWLLLTRVLLNIGPALQGLDRTDTTLTRLGPLTRGERVTAAVFAITVTAWISRPWLTQIAIAGVTPFAGLGDADIAIAAALALFLLPVARGQRAMDWQRAAKLPWGVLVLFGGGLTLAAAIEANGVAGYIASGAAKLGGWPVLAVVLTVVTVTVFASELTSNTAQVATLVPILAAAAPALGVDPLLLILACTFAASFAFMMPVGTPPNAIIFGSGLITIPRMCKTGVWLNLTAIAVVTVLCYLLVPALIRHSAST